MRKLWLVSVLAPGLALALALAACMTPPTPAERASDAAHELNLAARFGQLDVAIGRTARAARPDFLKRHAAWGQGIRIVDVELASLSLPESDRAVVLVDYAWVRNNEGSMRATRVEQHWKDDGGWHLVRERRYAGDLGLFGEVVKAEPLVHPDAHFAERTIRGDGSADTE